MSDHRTAAEVIAAYDAKAPEVQKVAAPMFAAMIELFCATLPTPSARFDALHAIELLCIGARKREEAKNETN